VGNGQRRQAAVKLFTSVLDDTKLLPHFLRHYVRSGIADFYILAPSELADEIEALKTDYRITLSTMDRDEMVESCRRGTLASKYMRAVREKYQDPDEWALIVDLDEFVDFDGESVASVIATADAEGANVVKAIMYDRFTEDGQPADIEPDADLAGQFPVRWRFVRDVKKGCDEKAVLVKGHLRPAFIGEHHRVVGERASYSMLTIDHYRWTMGSVAMLRNRSRKFREAGSGWWIEYERALEHYEIYGRFAWDEFSGELLRPDKAAVR
jgi:hypothetical protein